MRPRLAIALLTAGALLLTGCTPAPPRDEVVERFAIELAAGVGEPEDWTELAEGLADDALDGKCAESLYRTTLEDPTLQYAWSAGCLMYFEGSMSDSQVETAKQDLIDYISSTIDE